MQGFRDEHSVSHINRTDLAAQVLQSSNPRSNLFALPSSQTLQEFTGTEQTLPPSHHEDTGRLFLCAFLSNTKQNLPLNTPASLVELLRTYKFKYSMMASRQGFLYNSQQVRTQ